MVHTKDALSKGLLETPAVVRIFNTRCGKFSWLNRLNVLLCDKNDTIFASNTYFPVLKGAVVLSNFVSSDADSICNFLLFVLMFFFAWNALCVQ